MKAAVNEMPKIDWMTCFEPWSARLSPSKNSPHRASASTAGLMSLKVLKKAVQALLRMPSVAALPSAHSHAEKPAAQVRHAGRSKGKTDPQGSLRMIFVNFPL